MGKNVAILGATGAVGRQMLTVLEQRNFPIDNLYLLASSKSAGKKINFCGDEVEVCNADTFDFSKTDIVLGAASSAIAKDFAQKIINAGAVFVDNSSAFRLLDDVPLIVPEINGEDAVKHNGIISNPNCSTIITLMAVYSLNQLSPIKSIIASTYQATSGAGAAGPVELDDQMRAICEGAPIKSDVFAYQIANNLIPDIGGVQEFDSAKKSLGPDDSATTEEILGYTTEEMKMQNEGRKILHNPQLNVTCTCVRVPVVRSHSISASVFTENPITVEQARKQISEARGCKVVDDLENQIYPMPLDCSDQDTVFVGRIRRDLTFENGIALWCCGDQVRKGAATNTIQIAELLL